MGQRIGWPAASVVSGTPVNAAEQRDRKATQLPRILDAMIDVAAEEGYARASVARVIARAGVSRRTLYDYFCNRDECFVAAIGQVRGRLLVAVGESVATQPPERAAAAAVQALVGFAEEEPAMARVLFGEAAAAGARALDARDQSVVEIERIIEDAYRQVSEETVVAEVPARIVLGAVYRLLGCRLRDGEPRLAVLEDELLRWIESYGGPKGEHRWRALSATPAPLAAPSSSSHRLLRSQPQPSGRRRGGSGTQEFEERRRSVLFTLAELAAEKGYAAVTVGEISSCAGVKPRTFYRMFAGKQEAFAELAELYFQHMMALTAGAFFSARAWPERVIAAKLALAGCVEQNPALARACFIEGYAGEPDAAVRVERLTRAFTLFLAEGHEHAADVAPYPRAVLEAIAHANFELVYHQARASATPKMASVLGHSLHLCLAPFIGPSAAAELIDDRALHVGESS
jgi:AcrR family transcriptional regulator